VFTPLPIGKYKIKHMIQLTSDLFDNFINL